MITIFALALLAAPEASRAAKVDAAFAEWDRTDSPGCVVAVYQSGHITYARGYGMADLERGLRLTPQSVLDLGSISKQFTAFAVHLLARDGRLDLDDEVRRYLPELPDYGRPLTIRHLLHHTSGLRDYLTILDLGGFKDEDWTTEDDALQAIVRQRALNYPPGREYLYSNTGYFLLSQVVRRVSGKSLRDFAQEKIFGPLGMTHTQYNDRHDRIVPGRALSYVPGKDTVRHSGSWVGYHNHYLRFPEQKLSVACLCNVSSSDPSALAERAAEAFLGDRMEPARAATPMPSPSPSPAPRRRRCRRPTTTPGSTRARRSAACRSGWSWIRAAWWPGTAPWAAPSSRRDPMRSGSATSSSASFARPGSPADRSPACSWTRIPSRGCGTSAAPQTDTLGARWSF